MFAGYRDRCTDKAVLRFRVYCHHFVATRCDKSYLEQGDWCMKKALSLVLVLVFVVSLFGGVFVVPSAKAAVAQEVTYNLGG
jgi:hypothetical protein